MRVCWVRWSRRWSGRASSPPTPRRTTSSVRRWTGIVARAGSWRSLRAPEPPSGPNQPLRSSAVREKTRLHSFSRCILGPLCHSNLVFVKWKKAGFKTVHRTLVFLAKNGHAQTYPQEGRRVREDRRRSGLVIIVTDIFPFAHPHDLIFYKRNSRTPLVMKNASGQLGTGETEQHS